MIIFALMDKIQSAIENGNCSTGPFMDGISMVKLVICLLENMNCGDYLKYIFGSL